tara:strand:- start:1198 stop:1605 length:408 start_codon:yes stop_codon:yes gene_type:complete
MSKKKMKKKYKKWTTKDDERLVSMYAQGVKRADMARSMKRSVGTIDQRLYKMRKEGLYQNEIGVHRRKSKVPDHSLHNKVKKQHNPVNDFESVTKMFAQRHKEIEAKCLEQRLIIKDTMEKLDVLLGRLRWCLND